MTWVRFAWLKKQGIVDSWPQLNNLQEKYEFPVGRMLSPAIRAWDLENEIEPWLASRPIVGPPPRGAAKAAKDRSSVADIMGGDLTTIEKILGRRILDVQPDLHALITQHGGYANIPAEAFPPSVPDAIGTSPAARKGKGVKRA